VLNVEGRLTAKWTAEADAPYRLAFSKPIITCHEPPESGQSGMLVSLRRGDAERSRPVKTMVNTSRARSASWRL
jgi:hypothetical protein